MSLSAVAKAWRRIKEMRDNTKVEYKEDAGK